MTPCVFFDRDGIVNVPPVTRYVERVADLLLNEPFFDALKIALERGYKAVIITNQKGVSTGKTPLAELNAMHDLIHREAVQRGLCLHDIYYCDSPDDADFRRKPNPGMLFEAAEKHALDLSRSWMIGDKESDVITGQRAGCRTIYVGEKNLITVPDFIAPSMMHLPGLLEKELPGMRT